MSRWIIAAIVLAATFLGGWWLGRYVSRPETVERVRIDTVFYERPKPISTSDIAVSVNVPKLMFARDTIMLLANSGNVASNVASFTNQDTNQVTNYVSDSVQMSVTLRTLEYRDSTYYARVSGPVVGQLGPSLDYFETYSTTTTKTQIIRPKTTLSLSGVLGTDYSRAGWTPYVEAVLSYNFGPVTLSATAGVDDVFDKPTPRGGIEAAIPLWTK